MCIDCHRLRFFLKASSCFRKDWENGLGAGYTSGQVYLARTGRYTKIGYAANPGHRLLSLRGMCPNPVSLIHVIETDSMPWLEAALHLLFEDRHHWAEWFRLSPHDIRQVQELGHVSYGNPSIIRAAFPERYAASRLPALWADARRARRWRRAAT